MCDEMACCLCCFYVAYLLFPAPYHQIMVPMPVCIALPPYLKQRSHISLLMIFLNWLFMIVSDTVGSYRSATTIYLHPHRCDGIACKGNNDIKDTPIRISQYITLHHFHLFSVLSPDVFHYSVLLRNT